MNKKIDLGALFDDMFWGALPVIGMLAAVGLVAVVMRLSLGKW